MLFWNNDYSRGLAGHMQPVTSVERPASAQWCWLCHLTSDGLVESERHRSSSEENRSKWVRFRIAIYRSSGTIPYSALQFGWNSPVFRCFEIPRMPGHKVACRTCVRIPMYSGFLTPGTAAIHREYPSSDVNTIDRNIDYRSKCS